MFIRAIRSSFEGGKPSEEAIKLYNEKVKPLWSKQKGFHSIGRFTVVDGPHKGHSMVVVRFDSQEAFQKAYDGIAKEREDIMQALKDVGGKQEEILTLDEAD